MSVGAAAPDRKTKAAATAQTAALRLPPPNSLALAAGGGR